MTTAGGRATGADLGGREPPALPSHPGELR
jgi:hypothetical protein